jgi:hypothetical protein
MLRPTTGQYTTWTQGGRRQLTFSGIPLQTVLVRNLSKAVLGDSGQRPVVQMVLVDFSAKVKLALRLEFGVQSTCSSATRSRNTLRVIITVRTSEEMPHEDVQDVIGRALT